jgi:GntR family histidine utilization transcriptional repressor
MTTTPDFRRTSVHRQIVEDIERHIVAGDWPPGTRIPSEIDLAERYGCSRMTVNKAMTSLASAGLVERRRKTGTVVAWPAARIAALEIRDPQREIEATGREYSYRFVDRSVLDAPPRSLPWPDLPDATGALRVRALHLAADRPFCFEDRLISIATVPAATAVDFAATPPSRWLLQAVPWTDAEHRISAAAADSALAAALDLPGGAPILVIDRQTWNAGSPVTRVRLAYPASSHALIARFSPRTS